MGLTDTSLYPLAQFTHQRDETVAPHDISSYAMGWEVSLRGNGEISHGGLNPNYTSYLAFRSDPKVGIAVLANSNSAYTEVIGNRIIKMLAGEEMPKDYDPGDGNDKLLSIISIVLAIYILLMIAFLMRIIIGALSGKRVFRTLSLRNSGRLGLAVKSCLGIGVHHLGRNHCQSSTAFRRVFRKI